MKKLTQIIEQINLGQRKTMELFHMTKEENIDSILKNGFDLNKIKPNWMNDYAISFGKNKKYTIQYFTKGNGSIPDNLTLLKIKFDGNIISYNNFQESNSETNSRLTHPNISKLEQAKNYTKNVLKQNIDAIDLGMVVYVYNIKSIKDIQVENFR